MAKRRRKAARRSRRVAKRRATRKATKKVARKAKRRKAKKGLKVKCPRCKKIVPFGNLEFFKPGGGIKSFGTFK